MSQDDSRNSSLNIGADNNGLFDLAARAGLDKQSTYILLIEPK